MHTFVNRFSILTLALVAAFFSCQNPESNKVNMEEEMQHESMDSSVVTISQEVLESIIMSIPSPLEMSSMIKSSGADYNAAILCPTNLADNHSVAFKQALNLGVYGADLGYLNIYEKTTGALDYLSAIKNLADKLKIGQFFDFSTLKKLSENRGDIDSLLYISTSGFNNMEGYLREQKRTHLSVLMITGAWLEGAYIATQIMKTNPTEALKERIGEQKIIFDEIMLILDVYKGQTEFVGLIEKMSSLKDQFDKVTVTYTYEESEAEENEDGMLVIENKSTSTVTIDQEQIDSLTELISSIRAGVIN